jgi:hypothetical protein
MRTELIKILQLYPNGITTVDAAGRTMAALTMADLIWHMDDDPREVSGFTKDEGEALAVVSDQLWDVAEKNFLLSAGNSSDAMWEGLIDWLSVQHGIFAFRADTDFEGMVYVATTGMGAKVLRKQCLEAYDKWEEMMDEDTSSLIEWLQQQERWTA